MSLFTSTRERGLWLSVVVVVVAIWSTLGLAGTLSQELRNRELFGSAFLLGFVLIGVAVLTIGIRARARGPEIGVALGITAVYLMLFTRTGIIPEERTHLFEYGVVAIFVHEALKERALGGRRVPVPALLAFMSATLLGLLDETIQAILPDRVYDIVDVGFNMLAAAMAITASVALTWTRRRHGHHRERGAHLDSPPLRAADGGVRRPSVTLDRYSHLFDGVDGAVAERLDQERARTLRASGSRAASASGHR
jgi:hypothetical protein